MADQDVQNILTAEPVPQQTKADAWDIYHNSKDADDFASKISALPVSQATKAKLWDMKHAEAAADTNTITQDPGFFASATKMGKDALEGIGSGVISTGVGAYNLARKGAKAVGLGDLPEAPDFLKKAGANAQYDAQGNPIDTSNSFGAGRMAEQVGEFLAPAGLVGKGVKTAAKLGEAAELGAKVIGNAASSAGVTALQTGGDPDKIIQSGIISGAFSTTGGILQKILPANSSVYFKNLVIPKRFLGERAEDVMNHAIDEGILISKGGLAKAGALADAGRDAVDAEISKYGNVQVDNRIIESPVRAISKMARSVGKNDLANRIDGQLEDFLESKGAQSAVAATPEKQVTTGILDAQGNPVMKTIPGTPAVPAKPAYLTVADAQEAKRTFNTLAKSAFGTEGTSQKQIDTFISRGLKQSMEQISPEIAELNKNAQTSLLLKNAIEKYVQSAHDVVPPRTMLLLMFNKPAALLYGAWASPFVRSALAIAKDRVEKSAIAGATPAMAGAIPSLASSPQGPTQ